MNQTLKTQLDDPILNKKLSNILKTQLNNLLDDPQLNEKLSNILRTQLIILMHDEQVDEELVQLFKTWLDKTINNSDLKRSVNEAVKNHIGTMVEDKKNDIIKNAKNSFDNITGKIFS